MFTSEAIVEILGAGLPPASRLAIKGELDLYRRRHRSGRPVPDSELVPIAVTVTVSERFRRVNADHLPTLVSFGGLHVLAGTLVLLLSNYLVVGHLSSGAATYLPVIGVEAALVGTFLCARVPTRSLAAGSCLLGLALAGNALVVAPETLADLGMRAAMYGLAVLLPVLFVSLAWHRRHRPGCAWGDLPDVLRDAPVVRTAARALAFSFLVAVAAIVSMLVFDGGQSPLLDRLGLGLQALGLVLLWGGFRSVLARLAS
jgi:hypothetical protein